MVIQKQNLELKGNLRESLEFLRHRWLRDIFVKYVVGGRIFG
mgnify:FL=1